jgi:hypothetical protein
MADKSFDIQVKIKATSEDAALSMVQKQMGDVSAKLKGVADESGKTSSAFSGLAGKVAMVVGGFLSFGAAVSKTIAFIKSSVHEAMEAETAQLRFASSLRGTVNASDELIRSLDGTIAQIANVAGVSDEAAKVGLTRLVAVTKDTESAMNLLRIAMGMARLNGVSLDQVVGDIAKTMRGQAVRGTLEYQSVLQDVAKDGVITGAELVKLTARFGDLGVASMTVAGQQDILKERFANTKEEIGNQFLPLVKTAGTEILSIGGFISQRLLSLATAVRMFLAEGGEFNKTLVTVAKDLWNGDPLAIPRHLRESAANAKKVAQDIMADYEKSSKKLKEIWDGVAPSASVEKFDNLVIKLDGDLAGNGQTVQQVTQDYEKLLAAMNDILNLKWDDMLKNRKEGGAPEIRPVKSGLDPEIEEFNQLLLDEEKMREDSIDRMNREELIAKIKLYARLKALAKKNNKDEEALAHQETRYKIQLGLVEAQSRIAQAQQIFSAHTLMGKLLFRAQQGVAATQSIMSGFAARMKDKELYGTPAGDILGAIDVALGFASAAAIMSQKPPSARGGFDIPPGLNPVTQLHEKEMVLPAEQADVIRRLATSTTNNYGGNKTIVVNAMTGAYGLREASKRIKKGDRFYKSVRVR